MQLITKKTLVLLLGFFVSFAVIGCNTDTTTTTTEAFTGETPVLSNPDEVFYDGETFVITYGDIYEEFKINDGINRLLYMVDSSLLSSYLSAVTEEDIANKIKYLTYGTSDDDEIALLDPSDKQEYEEVYAENMNLLGYGDNEDAYVAMVVAKENYAIEQMDLADNIDETWYSGPTGVASYYESTYFEDLTSIKIRFYSETDAKNVLKDFNLVSIDGELRLYTGTKPIDEVPSFSFDDTNTVVLSDDELLSYFIQMYNYVYSYKTPINEDATASELITNEDLKVSYLDTQVASATLASFMFSTLGSYNAFTSEENTKIYYTYSPVKYYGSIDTSYYMILNVDNTEKVDVSDFDGDEAALVELIGQEVYDEIESRIIETNLTTSGFIAARVASLRTANDFVIYDYYLGIDYQAIDTTYVLNLEGDSTNVASFNGEFITADQLLTDAMNTNGGVYALYAAQMAVVMDAYFEEVYCTDETVACEYDIASNTSAKIEDHRVTLTELKASFESSYYVYYYTFDEYIYLAYGAKSEEDMIAKYYVKSTLQPYLVFDEMQKDDWALLTGYLYDLVEDYYNNYFSLNVKHLLIYLDRNEDGAQDDYQAFLASLDDQTEYDNLLADFEEAIRNYMEASVSNTYTTLITEYTKATRTDAVWGVFKNYGFYIMTEDLSATSSLTYLSTLDTYEPGFVDGLIAAYEEYNLPENVESSFIIYSNLVETSYGVHMLYATKGSDFEKPTAAFEMTYDTEGNPLYSVGIENDSDMLSIDQLKLYAEYRFYEIVYGTDLGVEETYGFTYPVIPTSVMNALEAYFTDLQDSMYVVGYLNIIVSDKLQTGSFVNDYPIYCDLTEAELKARIAEVGDIYFAQLFSSFDTITD